METSLLEKIFTFIINILVPIIHISILFSIRGIANREDDSRHKAAMKSGFWAGTILFIMVLIYQVSIFLTQGFPSLKLYQGFDLVLALGTALITFAIFLSKGRIIPKSFLGLTTLLGTFATMYALFHYLLIRTQNMLVLSLTLGVTFGILMHFANPRSHVVKILSGGDHH